MKSTVNILNPALFVNIKTANYLMFPFFIGCQEEEVQGENL